MLCGVECGTERGRESDRQQAAHLSLALLSCGSLICSTGPGSTSGLLLSDCQTGQEQHNLHLSKHLTHRLLCTHQCSTQPQDVLHFFLLIKQEMVCCVNYCALEVGQLGI